MTHTQRLLRYTKPYWKPLTFSLISASLFGLVSALPTYVLRHTIDEVFINRYSHLIIPFIGAFVSVFIAKGILMYVSSYSMHWVNNRVINDIRSDVFSKIIHFPMSFYQNTSTGALMSHFLNDVQMIQQASASAIRDGVRSSFEATFLVIYAATQNAKLGILMIIIGPILGYVIRKLGRARKNASLAIQSNVGLISSLLQEMFVGIREIKAFNAEATEKNRLRNYLDRCFKALMHNVHLECLLPALVESIAIIGAAGIFYVAAYQVLSGEITAGQLTSFAAAVLLAYVPLKKIVSVYGEVQYGLAAAERLFTLLDATYPSTENRTKQLTGFSSTITFDHVAFSYLHNQPVLTDISITLHKGQTIGFVGPSGSGKSTLCDMLLGFVAPTAGLLAIDGCDINTLSFESLRATIGYVGQRTFLFNDTIANNVAYARPGATRSQIIAACKAAHADEFITKLPSGYDTMVGENGTLLSGGQKQRLTIARALLKDPAILLFDEATSSLDEESENMIRQTIHELKGKKTLIIVSHRPTMLKDADRIMMIDNKTLHEITAPTPHIKQELCL